MPNLILHSIVHMLLLQARSVEINNVLKLGIGNLRWEGMCLYILYGYMHT